jgi:hypothetical protein
VKVVDCDYRNSVLEYEKTANRGRDDYWFLSWVGLSVNGRTFFDLEKTWRVVVVGVVS